jgi:hypothetical protein
MSLRRDCQLQRNGFRTACEMSQRIVSLVHGSSLLDHAFALSGLGWVERTFADCVSRPSVFAMLIGACTNCFAVRARAAWLADIRSLPSYEAMNV